MLCSEWQPVAAEIVREELSNSERGAAIRLMDLSRHVQPNTTSLRCARNIEPNPGAMRCRPDGQSFGTSLYGLSERLQNDQGGLLFRSPNATPRRPTWPRPLTRWGFFFCVALPGSRVTRNPGSCRLFVVLLLSLAISSKHLLQATARVACPWAGRPPPNSAIVHRRCSRCRWHPHPQHNAQDLAVAAHCGGATRERPPLIPLL